MKNIITILFLALLVGCTNQEEPFKGHRLHLKSGKMHIQYAGEGDVVQFKMFEGLAMILKKNKTGIFEGEFNIPNGEDALFSYDILVHQKDSLGNMIDLDYRTRSGDGKMFIWAGKNRTTSYPKAEDVGSNISHKAYKSNYLKTDRDLTIYTPDEVDENTPIIYMTDGSVVKSYAPYVDQMIREGMITPIILVGVHSSHTDRYEEYVDIGLKNETFEAHENFFYQEVMSEIEDSIKNWNGKRYIFGFSNGGAFCMHAGINHPELFEEVIAFSTADYISEFVRPIEFKFQQYPKFYMGAGRYEESIFKDNKKFVPKLKAQEISVEFKEFVSGHDYNVWKFEFLEYIEKRFTK